MPAGGAYRHERSVRRSPSPPVDACSGAGERRGGGLDESWLHRPDRVLPRARGRRTRSLARPPSSEAPTTTRPRLNGGSSPRRSPRRPGRRPRAARQRCGGARICHGVLRPDGARVRGHGARSRAPRPEGDAESFRERAVRMHERKGSLPALARFRDERDAHWRRNLTYQRRPAPGAPTSPCTVMRPRPSSTIPRAASSCRTRLTVARDVPASSAICSWVNGMTVFERPPSA